jgi:hypothetical protein
VTRALLPQHSRYDFVPLPERRDYSWPNGKRLAFVLTTNVEWFAFGAGLGHDPAKQGEPQTHRNYAWRDYGNRIGVWRLLELFDELELPAAHNANSLLYEHAPQVMAAIRRRGDEVVAHGRTNAENLRGLWQPDEERILREVTETIARHEGAPPAGWMGSGAYETAHTLDLLKELGYRYVMDWPMDDQPVWMKTRRGRILSVDASPGNCQLLHGAAGRHCPGQLSPLRRGVSSCPLRGRNNVRASMLTAMTGETTREPAGRSARTLLVDSDESYAALLRAYPRTLGPDATLTGPLTLATVE